MRRNLDGSQEVAELSMRTWRVFRIYYMNTAKYILCEQGALGGGGEGRRAIIFSSSIFSTQSRILGETPEKDGLILDAHGLLIHVPEAVHEQITSM